MPDATATPQPLEPNIDREDVEDAHDLWMPIDEDGNVDPDWYVFHYDDGAIRFINYDTEQSVWRGRDVVGFDDGDARVEAHYSTPLDLVALVAAKNVSMPPVDGTIVDPTELPFDLSELSTAEVELALRVLLSQWIRTEQGDAWHFDVETPTAAVFVDALSEADISLDDASEKPQGDRSLTEEFAVTLRQELTRQREGRQETVAEDGIDPRGQFS